MTWVEWGRFDLSFRGGALRRLCSACEGWIVDGNIWVHFMFNWCLSEKTWVFLWSCYFGVAFMHLVAMRRAEVSAQEDLKVDICQVLVPSWRGTRDIGKFFEMSANKLTLLTFYVSQVVHTSTTKFLQTDLWATIATTLLWLIFFCFGLISGFIVFLQVSFGLSTFFFLWASCRWLA